MKRSFTLVISCLLVATLSASAQNYTYWTEYFDDGATAITGTTANAATTPTPATIKTGEWITYYSFRAGSGCAAYNDPAVTSAKYIRILGTGATTPAGLSSNVNGPNAYIVTPTLSSGVNTVTWRNNSTSTSGAVSVYYSTNNGGNWTLAATVPTVATANCGELYSVTINNVAVNRIKFQNETTANQEIDNVTITSVTALPVTFSSSKAYIREAAIQVEWSVSTESNVRHYSIERSANGRDFSSVGIVESKGSSNTLTSYAWSDATPFNGANYYRVKALDKDGSSKFSGIMHVNISKGKVDLIVAPNPVKNNQLNLQFSDLTKGSYTLKVFNNTGQAVFTTQLSTQGGSLSRSLSLHGVRPGVYNLQVSGIDMLLNKKIVIE
jgi:hypothetical protein